MACGEGEEARITALAAELDTTIKSLKGRVGEIGDRRIAVMAGLMALDRLSQEEGRTAELSERALKAERVRDEAVARANTEQARANALASRVAALERAREEAILAADADDEPLIARLAAATAAVERLTGRLQRSLRSRDDPLAAKVRPDEEEDPTPTPVAARPEPDEDEADPEEESPEEGEAADERGSTAGIVPAAYRRD